MLRKTSTGLHDWAHSADRLRSALFAMLPIFGNFTGNNIGFMKTTSVALGSYFEDFIASTIKTGRYNNASEVIRAALRILEEHEKKIQELSNAIREGEESGMVDEFDPQEHLKELKALHRNG